MNLNIEVLVYNPSRLSFWVKLNLLINGWFASNIISNPNLSTTASVDLNTYVQISHPIIFKLLTLN